MKKKLLIPIIIGVLAVLAVVLFLIFRKTGANENGPDLVETPPAINKVNALALAKRPYVELIPHANPGRCNGVDMKISKLRNGEEKVEYELEYTTEKLIQGVFGRRDFTVTEEHAPLEFGTCSKGKCKCDDDINGGSLKLIFSGRQDYTLKGDFSVQNVAEEEGMLSSKDMRLKITVGDSLPKTANVLITSTFGLPADLDDEVILGPYGIFVEGVDELDSPMTIILQSKDVVTSKVQLWNGNAWQILEAQIDGDKAEFEIEKLGVIVLTK
jgi:hypothetical protein